MSTDSTQRIQETAGQWLARRHSDDWAEDDQRAFDRWLEESVHHRVAYLRLENTWQEAARLQALGAGVQSDRPPPPGQWNLTPFFDEGREPAAEARAPVEKGSAPRRARMRTYAVAASLMAVAMLAAAVFFLAPAGRTYETDVGGISTVPMPDGSKVTLNTDSQVRVAVTEKERRIEITHGEAFFEVARDRTRPFVVQAGKKRVIAVGTKFSVRRDEDEVRVVVTEGKVRVEGERTADLLTAQASHPSTPSTARSSEGAVEARGLYLEAGAVAVVSGGGVVVETRALSEAEEQLGWRTGVLIFRDESLAAAIAEFNRYNMRKIVIEDPSIERLRIEGSFRSGNIDAFARILEKVYSLHVTVDDERILVRR